MDYIENVLGIKVQYETWQYEAELPYYIMDHYELKLVIIGSVRAIFLYPKAELDQILSLKKQIARIQRLEAIPVVIVLQHISRNRREYMISAHIPFVVPGRQIYLPFMGIALQDKFETEILQIEQLQPSAQVLFFYYLYQKKKRIYTSEAIKVLGFSGMTITRAVRQLEKTGFFITEKEGVQKILIGKYVGRELFDKMQPYLISPVRKKIYVKKQLDLPELCMAGMLALSQKSMINPPSVGCYAVNGKTADWTGTDILKCELDQMEIELWKYDPNILGRNGIVDSLSLIMSLKENTDERIEGAIDEVLENVWEE